MIPKIIHYCWLSGDPFPEKNQKCIDTWKEKLPDYEFMLWDLNRFDIDSSIWVKQAFDNKKYAFAADYIRLYAVYHYGGIYLDTDVEVLKSYNDLLDLDYFIGFEYNNSYLEAATFGAMKFCEWIKKCLDYYNRREFVLEDGGFDLKVLPLIMEEILRKQYKLIPVNSIAEQLSQQRDGGKIFVFGKEFFCPKSCYSRKIKVTDNTYSIHQYTATWMDKGVKTKMIFLYYFPIVKVLKALGVKRVIQFFK